MQSWQFYEKQDYEQGLKFVEQAYEAAPNDSRVLYNLACYHSLLGHEQKSLNFLDQAVDAGFYSPRHISKDGDLESIRQTERFAAALDRARGKAAELSAKEAAAKEALARGIIDRLMNAVGILDYSATIETTEGYSIRTETITMLTPDAKSRPIYEVFGKRNQLNNFERYLPRETMSFSVSNGIDFGALYGYLEDTLRKSGPKGQEILAKWSEIQAELSLDVKQNIVGLIEGQSVSVELEDGRGSVMLIKVNDEQAALSRE